MDHSVEVLLIGGPCDSHVVSRPTSDTRFEVVPPRPSTEHIPIVFASEPRPESYFYEIHRLWDGEQPYRVAVWEGHDQSVIETLIEGYRSSSPAPTAAQAQAMQSALRDPRQP